MKRSLTLLLLVSMLAGCSMGPAIKMDPNRSVADPPLVGTVVMMRSYPSMGGSLFAGMSGGWSKYPDEYKTKQG